MRLYLSSKNIFAIFYILTFLFPIDSQAKELQFESIGVDQEFSSSSILEIIQDKKGFLWLGTGNGLYRYDGYEFTSYIENPYDSLSISGSYITALFEDKSRAIWIGTNGGGLNKYNHFLDRFTSYKNNPENAESISSNKIWFIFEDSNMSFF